jgi:hypothetical protein
MSSKRLGRNACFAILESYFQNRAFGGLDGLSQLSLATESRAFGGLHVRILAC